MARPLRIEFPGAIYHVTRRGNARLPIYEDDARTTRIGEIFSTCWGAWSSVSTG